MPVNQGGGGGRAGTDEAEDQFSFDQPYEINGQFTAETAQQINEMFRILFKSLKRGETKVEEVEESVDNLSVSSTQWTTIFKTTDETIQSDSVIGNDNTLFLTVTAGIRYRIILDVFYTSNAAADFKWSVVGPAVTRFFMEYSDLIEGGVRIDDTVNSDPGEVSHTTTTGDENHIWAYILIEPSATGTFAFEWAQGASSATDTTVRRGSYLAYTTY